MREDLSLAVVRGSNANMNTTRLLLLLSLLPAGLIAVPAATPASEQPPRPAIREFDVNTTAQLGRALYEEDRLAWIATDVLLANVSRPQLEAEKAAGWVVDTSGPVPLVRFLRQRATGPEARFDIVFPKGGRPEYLVPEDRTLTVHQLAKVHALQAADAALRKANAQTCEGTYNFAVLADPDGSGFLVYFLRAKKTNDDIPLGGHYRVSVAKDGETVERIDRLFASCLNQSRTPPEAKGGHVEALSVSHVVSSRPLETHVFLSLQEKLPFYVIVPDNAIWLVDRGTITPTNTDKETGPSSKKPKA